MAKDPAFLFYPGDASDDTQFMNRLERGCYFDLLKAQKKFTRFSLDQIKKVLGKDFDICWPALEIVLSKDDKGYFIEWADESIVKRKEFSESRRKNRSSKKICSTHDKDMNNICESYVEHMENENENENRNEDEIETGREKGSGKGKPQINPDMPIPANVLEAAEQNQWTFTRSRNTDFVKGIWKTFLMERVNDPPHKRLPYERNPSELFQYFLNWSRNKFPKTNGNIGNTNGSAVSKAGRSDINDQARHGY